MNVFLSYSREDARTATAIADDLREIGHMVWFDQELAGGQEWWLAILDQIRRCDLFAFVLSPSSLESQACSLEWGYAHALDKRILPLLCHADVRTGVLPAELATIQFVDCRKQDKGALVKLVKAIATLPAAAPLPATLPPPPAIPVSYLAGLAKRIGSSDGLSPQDQSFLFMELERGLDDPKNREDAIELLGQLRRRSDLLAHVAARIDKALKLAPPTQVRSPRERQDEPKRDPESRFVEGSGKPRTPNDAELQPRIPSTLNVDQGAILETLMRQAFKTGDHWIVAAGEDRVCLAKEADELVVMASFRRWGAKEVQMLESLGWTIENKLTKGLAAGALTMFGIATSGLGFALLGHKGTRDFLHRNQATKRFGQPRLSEAAMLVAQVFRTLAPGSPELAATNIGQQPFPTKG